MKVKSDLFVIAKIVTDKETGDVAVEYSSETWERSFDSDSVTAHQQFIEIEVDPLQVERIQGLADGMKQAAIVKAAINNQLTPLTENETE